MVSSKLKEILFTKIKSAIDKWITIMTIPAENFYVMESIRDSYS